RQSRAATRHLRNRDRSQVKYLTESKQIAMLRKSSRDGKRVLFSTMTPPAKEAKDQPPRRLVLRLLCWRGHGAEQDSLPIRRKLPEHGDLLRLGQVLDLTPVPVSQVAGGCPALA